jgi:hypothetical protein
MCQAQAVPVMRAIKNGLRERLDPIVQEPLPKCWVELIRRLNEIERAALITKPPNQAGSGRQ